MKWIVVVLGLLCAQKVLAQQDTVLDVVNWNIEWLGSTQNGPANKTLQEQNASLVLNYLKADLYGLCEIVDTAVLGRLVRQIPGNYGYVVSDYCSLAGSPLDADWRSGQKLAFVFNRAVFSNVQTKGLLRPSGAAYSNWASGRYPFLFTANARLNGRSRAFQAILIHAKSGTTNSDWNRRQPASTELKDSVDRYFGNNAVMIFGDYNDDLDVSIVPGLPSSYAFWVADSVARGYRSITLPLSKLGQKSTIGFNDVIDHQIISRSLDSMYVAGSARIRTDVVNVVPTYNSRNTSDHYPVSSQFRLTTGDTIPTVVVPPNPPQPAPTGLLQLSLRGNFVQGGEVLLISNQAVNQAQWALIDAFGRQLWQSGGALSAGPNSLLLSTVPAGIYRLLVWAGGQRFVHTLWVP